MQKKYRNNDKSMSHCRVSDTLQGDTGGDGEGETQTHTLLSHCSSVLPRGVTLTLLTAANLFCSFTLIALSCAYE